MKTIILELNGVRCIFDDIKDVLEDVKIHLEEMNENSNLNISIKEMDEEEFDSLPEFNGW